MAKQTKLEIRLLPIKKLRPYKHNARTHSKTQIEQLKASLQEFGFTNPVLIDGRRNVIAGHGRLLAAEALGIKEVPTIALCGLTPEQAKAYRLADNQIALNSAWDLDLLAADFNALEGAFEPATLGFSFDQAAAFADATQDGVETESLLPTGSPKTKPGDLWLLGNHRLKCGDATDADDVADCLDGAEPHLMVTDPPYGVEYDASWRNGVRRRDGSLVGAKAVGPVKNDHRCDWRAAWDLFPGAVAYVWHASLFADQALWGLRTSGFMPRAEIVWLKRSIIIGRGHYHWQHEPCFYAVREGKTGHWNGSRRQSTVWEIAHLKSETGHSTQKPIECMRRPILNNSKIGQAVYDPFLGSGTTLIACEQEHRVCYGLEIDPVYCDVIVGRWEALTGKTARRADKTP